MENQELVKIEDKNPTESVDNTANRLINRISKATNKDELQGLYQEFNINNTKKNAIRVAQLNQLLDRINSEATERITKRPEQISNKEMLDYMTAIGNQIERSQKLVDGIKDINAVQVNNNTQNTVNINVGGEKIPQLSKDSREKITDVITALLKETGDTKTIDVTPEESKNDNEQVDVTNADEFEGDD